MSSSTPSSRLFALVYGTLAYLAFLAVFLYLAGFLNDFLVPRSINHGPIVEWPLAFGIDVALLALFGLQHSVMARRGFKGWLTRVVPQPLERATYMFATCGVLALFYFAWRPLPFALYELTGQGALAMRILFALGVAIILISTFLIDHFHLFGVRQVIDYARGLPARDPAFFVSRWHRHVRHPLYVGWILTMFATPKLTFGHLVFALGFTLYILIAIRYEERDLVSEHGVAYAEYRRKVPMLIPSLRGAAMRAGRVGTTDRAGA